jgi:hypothetical protein
MDIQIITVFYLCDKLLEALGHRQDPQTKMSDASWMFYPHDMLCCGCTAS